MKNFPLNPVVAAVMMAGLLCAASVRAGDIDVYGGLGEQTPIQVHGNSADGLPPTIDLPAIYQLPRNAPTAKGMNDPALDEDSLRKLNEDGEDAHSAATVGKYAALAPFALSHVSLDLSGPDSSEAVPNMALGPQYTLNSKVTLGGTWAGHDTIALGDHSGNEPYTFGLRVMF